MKRQVLFLLAFAMVLLLCGCCMSHDWADADCTTPKTCSKCAETEGEALGHQWQEATCTAPKTCSSCAETEGELLEHIWGKEEIQDPNFHNATAVFVKKCLVCGEEVKRTGKLEKLVDEDVFLMTPEEFSDRFTYMLTDIQSDFGDDRYFSYIDQETNTGNLKMYMCQQVNGNVKKPGKFEMSGPDRNPLLPAQNTESGVIWKVHGTVKGKTQARLAAASLLRTTHPDLTVRQAYNLLDTYWLPMGDYYLTPMKHVCISVEPKGGQTYYMEVYVRY